MRRAGVWLVLVLLAATQSWALAQPLRPLPELTARVTDLASTLDAGQRAALDERLAAIEARKGAQVAVLIVPTTRPESIEDYSMRVVERWKLGRGAVDGRAVDDGVLVLVAKDDRRVRIEVGYGLEGAIPDALARRIIAESIAPRFRQGDYHGGLLAAVDELGRLIEGEALPEPWTHGEADVQTDLQQVLAAIVTVFVLGMFAIAVFGRLLGSAAAGAGSGIHAWTLGAPFALAVAVGVGAFVLFLVFAQSYLRGMGRGVSGRGGRSVWTGGPGIGGWGGGGGFRGGGGFGGGGGRFGGGGASGGW